MSIFKRTQRKYVKKAYRVRNWREYEAGLRNRGSLTVWISLTAGKLVNWDAPRPRRRKPGRQRKYSNHAIETAVTLGMVFHLSSRQSEGLLRSLFALMKLDNDVPDHTTISRRKAKLGKVPFYQDKQKTPLHTLIDSSGLAVHAGQLRRAPKSRDYRKLHLCVDEQTGEVVAGELTSKRARDSSRVASLVGQIDSPISSARADTAYDASGVYEAIENHSAHRSPRVLIPPRKGAQLASGPASSRQRNRNIAAQARLGKRKWHTESGYSNRSKVETTFHRYKAIVGSAMRARGLAAQRVEARIGCKILNTMTALGMPDSEMIGRWESGPSELSASIGVVHQGKGPSRVSEKGVGAQVGSKPQSPGGDGPAGHHEPARRPALAKETASQGNHREGIEREDRKVGCVRHATTRSAWPAPRSARVFGERAWARAQCRSAYRFSTSYSTRRCSAQPLERRRITLGAFRAHRRARTPPAAQGYGDFRVYMTVDCRTGVLLS